MLNFLKPRIIKNNKHNGFSYKKFTNKNRKYILGLNLHEHPLKINIGIIDLEGTKISSENIDCGGLIFRDERYLYSKRMLKLKEICIKSIITIFSFS